MEIEAEVYNMLGEMVDAVGHSVANIKLEDDDKFLFQDIGAGDGTILMSQRNLLGPRTKKRIFYEDDSMAKNEFGLPPISPVNFQRGPPRIGLSKKFKVRHPLHPDAHPIPQERIPCFDDSPDYDHNDDCGSDFSNES